MATSRIQRFKDYRNSLIKEDAPVLKTPENEESINDSHIYETTSTLPMDQVMDALSEEGDEAVFHKKAKKRKIIIYSLTILGLLAVTAGIVVFAILVF